MICEVVAASIDACVVTEDIDDKGHAYKTTDVGEWIVNHIIEK